jgi:hypothetical protein
MKTIVDGYLYLKGGYAIQGDSICVTLYKERVTKKGQKQLDVIGYYPDISKAFNRLIDSEINQATDLQYLNEKIAELRAWCEELINNALTTPSEARSEALAANLTKDKGRQNDNRKKSARTSSETGSGSERKDKKIKG